MGLDLVLGVVVLVLALRGWFRGFSTQAIRLVSLVAAVYAAGPLRDVARPVVDDYVAIDAGVLGPLLWWVAAALAFVLASGVATNLLAGYRRRRAQERSEAGLPGHRGDQSAGALLGAAKGAILASFLMMGLERYAPEYARDGGWVGQQIETSRAFAWSTQLRPAERLWEAGPVRRFVSHVRRMGLSGGDDAPGDDREGRRDVASQDREATVERRHRVRRPTPPLAVEPGAIAEMDESELAEAVDRVLRELEGDGVLDRR